MKKYLFDYIREIDDILTNDKKINSDLIDKHLIKISFFQHERLVHLLVTLFFSILFLLFVGLCYFDYRFFVIALILFIFVICYVVHYFYLENGVQRLYKQYDEIIKK